MSGNMPPNPPSPIGSVEPVAGGAAWANASEMNTGEVLSPRRQTGAGQNPSIVSPGLFQTGRATASSCAALGASRAAADGAATSRSSAISEGAPKRFGGPQ